MIQQNIILNQAEYKQHQSQYQSLLIHMHDQDDHKNAHEVVEILEDQLYDYLQPIIMEHM